MQAVKENRLTRGKQEISHFSFSRYKEFLCEAFYTRSVAALLPTTDLSKKYKFACKLLPFERPEFIVIGTFWTHLYKALPLVLSFLASAVALFGDQSWGDMR